MTWKEGCLWLSLARFLLTILLRQNIRPFTRSASVIQDSFWSFDHRGETPQYGCFTEIIHFFLDPFGILETNPSTAPQHVSLEISVLPENKLLTHWPRMQPLCSPFSAIIYFYILLLFTYRKCKYLRWTTPHEHKDPDPALIVFIITTRAEVSWK